MPQPGDSDETLNGTPAERARMIAEKVLRRLRELNQQYPSQDLENAIAKLEHWRQEHFEPPEH
jgi:hypothetical protein